MSTTPARRAIAAIGVGLVLPAVAAGLAFVAARAVPAPPAAAPAHQAALPADPFDPDRAAEIPGPARAADETVLARPINCPHLDRDLASILAALGAAAEARRRGAVMEGDAIWVIADLFAHQHQAVPASIRPAGPKYQDDDRVANRLRTRLQNDDRSLGRPKPRVGVDVDARAGVRSEPVP